MRPLGECRLPVEYNGRRHLLNFQVVEDTCRPLLSAETCKQLDLIKLNTPDVNSVHQLSSATDPVPFSKETLVEKYNDVFHGLRHFGDTTIVVKDSVKPVQHCPRRVPVALHADVKTRTRVVKPPVRFKDFVV